MKNYLPENAAHRRPRSLRSGPLLETRLMDVISARGFTPYNFLSVRLKGCEADGAVPCDSFTVGGKGGGG